MLKKLGVLWEIDCAPVFGFQFHLHNRLVVHKAL